MKKLLWNIIGTIYWLMIMFLVSVIGVFGFFYCVFTEGIPFIKDMWYGFKDSFK